MACCTTVNLCYNWFVEILQHATQTPRTATQTACVAFVCYNLFASLDTSLNNVSDRIAGARGTEINTRDKPQSTVHMIGVYCAKIAY
jgi:hypothetical protein